MKANNFPAKRRQLVLTGNLVGSLLPVAFFDADSTIRVTRSGKPSPHGRHDVIILPESFKKLEELVHKGYVLVIVSNQAGIDLGYISLAEVEEAFQETLHQFSRQGIFFNYYDFAEKKDENRKPEIEMARRLERKMKLNGKNIDWNKSFMVGDAGWKKGRDFRPDGSPGIDHSSSDRIFAENLARFHEGFAFFHAKDFFSQKSADILK
ncbi:MAG: bifunctional polynucleotide phosphatase/kinase [Clostridiales bacterium]|jgi:D-glycero-D-manno-heptose 1,7-bisphosphate phosphatase|nr:bifunctional polynucleotide phosphatase/kinase [Clostridiales bacterium]MDN5283390.1 bifunctional polynucleotide phosphatase/kinase [Candidatus Ozemobacter sp.]